jgi:DNA gyrase subunit A
MLISSTGTLVRTPVADISVVGRNTQGVRLIRLEEGDQLSGLERIDGIAETGAGEVIEAPGDEAPGDASPGDASPGDGMPGDEPPDGDPPAGP